MLEFFRKYRHVLTGLLLLLVTLQIPIYRKQDRSLGFAAKVFYTLAYYPQNGWDLVTDGIVNVLENYVYLVHVAGENERLNTENARLRNRLFELREASAENERLRDLLAMRERNSYLAIGTRVIALDASNWFRSFTVNAGSSDGLETGMPVVTDEGLVGTVVSVAPFSSKVLPVVDLNSSIPVVSQRTRARGMVVGRGSKAPVLNFLERAEDMRAGDLLVTSGLGGAFPAGVPVATVRTVTTKSYGLFQEAELDTVVQFGRVENVAVLRYRAQDQIPAFQAPPTAAATPVTAETNLVASDEADDANPIATVKPKQKPKPAPAPAKPARVSSADETPGEDISLGDRSLPVIPAAMPRIPKPARVNTERPAEIEAVGPSTRPATINAERKPAPPAKPAKPSTTPATKPVPKPAPSGRAAPSDVRERASDDASGIDRPKPAADEASAESRRKPPSAPRERTARPEAAPSAPATEATP